MSDDRAPRYVEDGRVIYRASALGGCPQALAAYAMGIDPAPYPQWFQKVLTEGHELEDRVLEKAGLLETVIDQQREVELNVGRVNGRPIVVRAHMDGRDGGLVPMVVEVKKFRDSNWAAWHRGGMAAFPRYEWQVSVMMHALGEECLMVIGHATPDEKSREMDISEVTTLVIGTPPVSMAQIRAKIQMIEKAIDSGEQLACEPAQYPCPFFFLHADDAEEKRTRVNETQLIELAQRVARHDIAAKDQKRMADEAKQELKELMIASGYKGEKLRAGKFNITHVVSWQAEREQKIKAHEKNYVIVKETGESDVRDNRRAA